MQTGDLTDPTVVGPVVVGARDPVDGVWGVRPRNMEQTFLLDLLLNDDLKLVTIVGKPLVLPKIANPSDNEVKEWQPRCKGPS